MDKETFDRKYTKQLNQQQTEAVHAVDGAVLLLAVPGSGKTTVLVTRLGYMICCCNIPASRILTMTYTRASTKEMAQRFSNMFGEDCKQTPEFRTINGVSTKIVDFYSRTCGNGPAFELMDNESRLSKIVADLYHELSGEFATPSITKELRKNITYAKNMMLSNDDIDKLDTGFDKFSELYIRYNQTLKQHRQMDYDDQLVYAKMILKKHPNVLEHFQNAFQYICVDESQDTSKIQHEIILLLAQKSGNIFMVGDEDQSVYGFRAAYPNALMEFEHTYAGARVLLMEENYRSTPEILFPADAFVQKNSNRHPKTIHPTRASGENVGIISVANRAAQYQWLACIASQNCEQVAVLYRNNDSALPLIDLFDRIGVSYRCKQMDDMFFTNRIVMDVLDIIAFAHDAKDTEVFMRIYYKCGGKINKNAAEYACNKSKCSEKSILEELLGFPQLSSNARESVIDLIELLPKILKDTAIRGLKRIWNELCYKDYVERRNLDTNKFEILCLLAERERDLDAFAARLEYLRGLVSDPPTRSDNSVILSTIHSSKGLEYDTVYILDVIDNVLPAVTDPKNANENEQYQEERRLFYVAITRAKNKLYLFSCLDRESAFAEELQLYIPMEATKTNDVFSFLTVERCGKQYYHAQKGCGTIIATCDEQNLITYSDGETQLLSIEQMYKQRMIVRRLPEKSDIEAKRYAAISDTKLHSEKQIGLSQKEKNELIGKARRGQKITHKKFGQGTIVSYKEPIVTVLFAKFGKKDFILIDSVERGLLYYNENQ